MTRSTPKVKLRRSSYSLFDPVERQIAPRVLLVEFFYWPFLSVGLDEIDPLAVVGDRGVVAYASPKAIRAGIKIGDRVRTSVSLVPDLLVISADAVDRNGSFAKIANVLERFSPLVEVVDIGVCATNTKGPSRYFGGDENLIAKVRDAVLEETMLLFPMAKELQDRSVDVFDQGSVFSFGVSIADGIFTARIAARNSLLIPPGESGSFLAPLSICELSDDDISGTLNRLGVHTLGDFVNLDFSLVLERFGYRGALLHRMAEGLDTSLLQVGEIKEDFNQKIELSETLEAASTVIFTVKAKVEEMLQHLLDRGYLCQIMRVHIVSENGEESKRDWGVKDGFSPQLLLERIRWQLEAWSSDSRLAPTAGVKIIELQPERLISSSKTQLDLQGSDKSSLTKVSQALSRVDSIVGERASFAKIKGARTPMGSVEMIPWQLHLFDFTDSAKKGGKEMSPWPGKLPGPSPALCFDSRVEVSLLSKEGSTVELTSDVFFTVEPCWLELHGPGRRVKIVGWSTPWPISERWWDPDVSTKLARVQVLTEELGALLIKTEGGRWFLEGSYD